MEDEIYKRLKKHSDLQKILKTILEEEQKQNFIELGKYSDPDEANHCRITDKSAKKIVDDYNTKHGYNTKHSTEQMIPIHSCGPITSAFKVCPNRLENVDLDAIKKMINTQ